MNLNFLLLVAAACILRYLAAESKRIFASRLASLLPRKVLKEHLNALREYPQHHLTDHAGRAHDGNVQ